MLRFRRSSFNGVQDLIFIHGFRQLTLYSTSISTKVNSNFVNYLVENLGFSDQQAISTSFKFNRQRRGYKEVNDNDLVTNSDSVIAFLKKMGLEQSQIRNAIVCYPRMLLCNVEKTLTPKTEYLQKLGFSESVVGEVVGLNPAFVLSGLNSTIVPVIEALLPIMGSKHHVITVLKKVRFSNFVVIPKYLVPNVALLRSCGIPDDLIRKHILLTPSAFLRTTDVFKDAVTVVEQKFGIPRNSPQFLRGIKIVTCFNVKTIESKMQIYKSFGWTDSDVEFLVSSCPNSLAISGDTIKKKLDFLMNELGYNSSYLASSSCLLLYSLEKRVVPRHKVIKVLKENGLIRKDIAFSTILAYNEALFLNKFVLPFKEVHEIFSKHAGIRLDMVTPGSSKLKPNAV